MHSFLIELEFSLEETENQSTHSKASKKKGENQQQTQPTNDVDARIWTWDTLLGGKRCHAPLCQPWLEGTLSSICGIQ